MKNLKKTSQMIQENQRYKNKYTAPPANSEDNQHSPKISLNFDAVFDSDKEEGDNCKLAYDKL